MSEEECCGSGSIFPAIGYRALDYAHEASTRQKLTIHLFALPMPYNPDNSDLYPHTGNLPEVTFRKPWIRGNKISTCKLSISGSLLADLGINSQLADSLENLNVKVTQVKGAAVDVVPSSNPNSQVLDRDQAYWLLREAAEQEVTLCQEVFSKSTEVLKGQTLIDEDLLLPEEVLLVDCLPQFRKHLPTLRAKLARLRTLPVPDPLLSPAGGSLSEDTVLRHCAGYEVTHDEETESRETFSNTEELFSKEMVSIEESLLLPVELDICTLMNEYSITFPNPRLVLNVTQELMDEPISCLDLQYTHPSLDISQFEVPHSPATFGPRTPDLRSPAYLMLPTELEMDLPLTPNTKISLSQMPLSPAKIPAEPLSPVYWKRVMSETAQKEMEKNLWMAERHTQLALRFLLTELVLPEPAIHFQPLTQALTLVSTGQPRSVDVETDPPAVSPAPSEGMTGCHDFTESMSSEPAGVVCALSDEVEDFTPLSPSHMDNILNESIVISTRSGLSCETPPPLLPQPHWQSQSAAGAITGGPIRSSSDEVIKEANHTDTTGSSVCAGTVSQEPSNLLITPGRRDDIQPIQGAKFPRLTPTLRLTPTPTSSLSPRRTVPLTAPPEGLDPLTSFMMLRSLQRAPVPAVPQSGPSTPVPKAIQSPESPVMRQRMSPDTKPANERPAVTGHDIRVQDTTNKIAAPDDRHDSRVIEVQATGNSAPAEESQRRAFSELRTLARACLSRVGELGLNTAAFQDFLSLAPDGSRFLLKQQEKELSLRRDRDHEEMYNQASVIHILVTAKDLLLQCDLNTAVDFLSGASGECVSQGPDQGLGQLSRRLQVLLFLSQRNREQNPKILEMQEHITTWLRNGRSLEKSKVLVIVTSASDCSRAMIFEGLTQATGQTVSALSPVEGRKKLDKARVLNSLRGSTCVVVSGRHVGMDFPWQSFSLVVEYDHTPPSPWESVCRQRSVCCLTFRTTLHRTDDDPACWSLELKVPYTVFVTEGLLNCPLLLHLLESTYNMTVLERSYSQSLERLGGTQYYAVVTVDESTAVVIQEQEELCRGRACEGVVLRLMALSLQYSCCWLLIHCPDSQGEGLDSEAFNNLVLIYSSLVLFGLKSEDLDVKVLIVPRMEDVAAWISQIAFHTLISSQTDAFTYLSREWLSVLPSEEEKCLLAFPCVNPMVAQMMLSRAPSLQWLLGAPLPQLQELLPEVPLKVLKLFSETTSLYKPTTPTTPSPPESHVSLPQTAPGTPSPPWITNQPQHHQLHRYHHPQAHPGAPDVFPPSSPFDGSVAGGFHHYHPVSTPDDQAGFQVDLSHPFGSESSSVQQGWQNVNPWGEEEEGQSDGRIPGGGKERSWTGSEAYGSQREPAHPGAASLPFQHASSGSSFRLQDPACSNNPSFSFPHGPTGSSRYLPLTSPRRTRPWSSDPVNPHYVGAQRLGGLVGSPEYGNHFRSGQERKRMAAGGEMFSSALTPLKRGKLSYEKVPGRSDGQTRLRFF